MTRLLRIAAFAIALAGVIDPAIALIGAVRPRVAVVESSAAPAARQVREALVRTLAKSYEVVPYLTADAAAAVVIGNRYPMDSGRAMSAGTEAPFVLPDDLIAATVTVSEPVAAAVRIVAVESPRDVPPATVIPVGVDLERAGFVGQTTVVSVAIAGVEAGTASHQWTEREKRWHATVDAVPVGEPPYVLRVAADHQSAVHDIVVDLRRAPLRVEFYDPRPSWATTFVRRALEGDARFEVSTVTFSSRGVSAQTGGGVALGDPRLDAFEVVIVGGLERLSVADAHALERFMRDRGGAVLVVADQRLDAGPALDLIAGGGGAGGVGTVASGSPSRRLDLVEQLLEEPSKLIVASTDATLLASELLLLRGLTPGSEVIAHLPGADAVPVIASMPRGEGRLLVSGAMDAWRFRAAGNHVYDRFWQSTLAGLALVVAPPIAISVDPPLMRPGELGEVTVRGRGRDLANVSASIDGQPIRLLPDAEVGVYRGRFVARDTPGRSMVEARAEGATSASPGPTGPGLRTAPELQRPVLRTTLTTSKTLLVQSEVRRVATIAVPSLAVLSSSHRGIDVTPEHLDDLERFLRSAVIEPRASLVGHPMRSPWWIVPFVACLSAEWWLRRRRGLR